MQALKNNELLLIKNVVIFLKKVILTGKMFCSLSFNWHILLIFFYVFLRSSEH